MPARAGPPGRPGRLKRPLIPDDATRTCTPMRARHMRGPRLRTGPPGLAVADVWLVLLRPAERREGAALRVTRRRPASSIAEQGQGNAPRSDWRVGLVSLRDVALASAQGQREPHQSSASSGKSSAQGRLSLASHRPSSPPGGSSLGFAGQGSRGAGTGSLMYRENRSLDFVARRLPRATSRGATSLGTTRQRISSESGRSLRATTAAPVRADSRAGAKLWSVKTLVSPGTRVFPTRVLGPRVSPPTDQGRPGASPHNRPVPPRPAIVRAAVRVADRPRSMTRVIV